MSRRSLIRIIAPQTAALLPALSLCLWGSVCAEGARKYLVNSSEGRRQMFSHVLTPLGQYLEGGNSGPTTPGEHQWYAESVQGQRL